MAKKTQFFKINISFEKAIKELWKQDKKIPEAIKLKKVYRKDKDAK